MPPVLFPRFCRFDALVSYVVVSQAAHCLRLDGLALSMPLVVTIGGGIGIAAPLFAPSSNLTWA